MVMCVENVCGHERCDLWLCLLGGDSPHHAVGTNELGCFLAPLIARIEVRPLRSIAQGDFLSLMEFIRDTHRTNVMHQGLSLAQIQTAMPQPARGKLFNTFVSVTPSLELASFLHFEPLDSSTDNEFDLSLVVATGTITSVGLEYDPRYIDKSHAESVAHSVE
ncbi:hypothetical protein CLAFUW4_03877 [Fulvia fulva]|uniref:Uncharacterized protein n=1 Tax=Passalora fulva TaxID=5499 RepID=A0A9Q8LBM3_PASFU|nr:uncharacterized protein CLAFUR5_03849 [Fulvia fulva]KAK4631230.1 hypothetical protein CLAFUR4_03865 [Fulvia fulva]KAK4632552.1 hypothetical protein CLAFUR0_03864 [Fulvia fulva]UJO14433.1 hypothetical protein CLAFUR5_03849 [Fulvia fulva]WPV10778.1 hypothetical protein CLAFUW4_03877 [Fulvia fulva]WPV25919.1 hypothetical protein CLAFUW7_03869 [Fulvia fulva]